MKSEANITEQNINVVPDNSKIMPGFMQEDNGKNSSMRLMSLVALISAIAFGVITLAHPDADDVVINLTYSFLVAAFTPKAVQKFAKTKVK